MKFLPTKEELEELGLDTFPQMTCTVFKKGPIKIIRCGLSYSYYISNTAVYPQSIEDIKTLIKLLTPHEN